MTDPKYTVMVQVPAGVSQDEVDAGFALEREALDPIGAKIVGISAKTEEEFIAAARNADALIARGRRITRESSQASTTASPSASAASARTPWTSGPRRITASWSPTSRTCSSTKWPTTP